MNLFKNQSDFIEKGCDSHDKNHAIETKKANCDKMQFTDIDLELLTSLCPHDRKKYIIYKRFLWLTDKLSAVGLYFDQTKQEGLCEFNSVAECEEHIQMEIETLRESVLTTWPDFVFPAQNKLPNTYLKVPIPEEEYPEYNFVGMLIGPKGATQRTIEEKTGAKLLIVGTSIHEEFGVKYNSLQFRSDEPLHLKINGPSKQIIEAAYALIKPLLTPKPK